MQSVKTIALWGVVAPCFALALSSAAFAQTVPSSPAERAQTQTLNQNITNANTAAVAQSDENNAKYQAQLRLYKARVKNYDEQATRYEAARDRYTIVRARYHRGAWPTRYEHSIVVYTDELLGAPVKTSNGNTIGRVEELALASGHVDAIRVLLDSDRGVVWIESADLRFDADKRVVVTNLDRHDLYEMTHERY